MYTELSALLENKKRKELLKMILFHTDKMKNITTLLINIKVKEPEQKKNTAA